jgi:carboxypeptidase D
LQEFLTLHADKFLQGNTLSRNLFFAGESHAGHYIPSMMNYIQKQNKKSPKITIPLSGAAIGNGWVDPWHQYSAHDAAYGYSLIGRGQKRSLEEKERQCQDALGRGKYTSSICFELLDNVVDNSQGRGSGYIVSHYDYRKWEQKSKPREFPPGHNDVEAYLGGFGSISSDYRDVLKAVHSLPSLEAGQRYRECTDPPYNALKHQDGLGVTPDVVDLLNDGVTLLFFNGVNDLICNHIGNEVAVENFKWNHQKDFQVSKRYGWRSPSTGQLGGYMREFKNLRYLKVLNSGHMVPLDVPDVSLDMMRNLVFGISFDDYEQQLASLEESPGKCPVCPASTECEACPTCPTTGSGETSEAADSTTGQVDHSAMTITIPKARAIWAFVGLAGVICAVWLYKTFQKNRARRPVVPPYDLELSSSTYTDKPDDENGSIS